MLEYGQQTGMLVDTMLKLSFQRDWLRRKVQPDSPLTFLWLDEAQYHLTTGSGGISKGNLFQQSCRESRIVPVYITQNILNFAEALGEHVPGSRTNAFLGNIRLKIFLQQNDVDKNVYAAELIGKYYGELEGRTSGMSNVSISINQQLLYRVDPFVFTALLKPEAEWFACEAIVYQGGKEFFCSRDGKGIALNCARLAFTGA